MSVIVVEDDEAVRGACAVLAEHLGCYVQSADSVAAARLLLDETAVDLVFLDRNLPGEMGDTLLPELRATQPRALVVIMTAHATVHAAVDLLRDGAYHFLQKPCTFDQIKAVIEQAAEKFKRLGPSRVLLNQLQIGFAAGRLIGVSRAMQKVFKLVAQVAGGNHSVLIVGEQGTGKEVVARAIHANGPRALSPFIPIDCDAIDPSRTEDCLFGYERGATDSMPSQTGLLASAGDGTILFCEIGALNVQIQARLARALADRQFTPNGAKSPVPFRARVLASSSSPLEAMAAQGRFRRDLYSRVNVAKICVPPLRERVEDIPLLADYFLISLSREYDIEFTISDDAMASLMSYEWTDNITELETSLEYACATSTGPILNVEDLPTQVRDYAGENERALTEETVVEAHAGVPMLTLQEMEIQAIRHALSRTKGDKITAAKQLGIGKTTLYRRLKEYKLSGYTDSDLKLQTQPLNVRD